MERSSRILVFAGVAAMVAYVILSSLVSDTALIWYQTRLFGLLSYLVLFAAMVLGELRLVSEKKTDIPDFRYHKPLAIFALYLVLLHFVSSFMDEYKWGRQLNLFDYTGFSFGNSWLVFLSFGTLGLYLMLIISATSASKAVQWMGFGRWKVVHYLSYVLFVIAYLHSVNLGTDVKSSVLSTVVAPFMELSFLMVLGLFTVRVLKAMNLVTDNWEAALTAVFCIAVILSASSLLSLYYKGEARINELQTENAQGRQALSIQDGERAALSNQTRGILLQLAEVKHGSNI